MGFYFHVALKNVFRQKKRSFTLGINYTIVTFILVLLLSFSQGAKINITNNVARSNAGHLTISGEYYIDGKAYKGIRDYPLVQELITKELGKDVEVFSRYLVRSALYYKGISKRLQFNGIDTERDTIYRDQINFLKGDWQGFNETANGVIMPESIANYFELSYDDEVVIATRTRFGAFNTGTLKVKGIYTAKNFFIRDQVISHFNFLQALDLAAANTASLMYIYFPEPNRLNERREVLIGALEGQGFKMYKPQSDTEALDAITAASPRYKKVAGLINRTDLTIATLDEALGLVKNIVAAVNGIGFMVTLIMLFIVAVSIFINLRMSIHDRLSEIGTMRAMGLEAGAITFLFILENIILALLSSLIGIILALLVTAALTFLIPVPSVDILSLFVKNNHFVLIPAPEAIAGVIGLILLFSACFSFFPARYGGRIKPVDALNKSF